MASVGNPPLSKRSVVSCFIIQYRNGQPFVALFRRSGKVSTYQHRLAPISGSIDRSDPTPLAAAWRELQEETTLTPPAISLLRQGKPYTFSDASIGREWTIYPFAFLLGDGAESRLRTDWEHEAWGWHNPLSVSDDMDFNGVPRLAESLRRVWFEKGLGAEAGAVLARGLEKLRTDQESGARQLAGVALEVLRSVVAGLGLGGTAGQWWANVRFAAWHLWKNGRESMGAAVMNVLVSALSDVEAALRDRGVQATSTVSEEVRSAVMQVLDGRISSRQQQSSRLVSEAFAKYLEGEFAERRESRQPISILTMSESSTISASIRQLVTESGFTLDLRVLESRPLYEGVSLAGSFIDELVSAQASPRHGDAKVKISLYSDAAAALASEGVDMVVIGADRIASNGAVSNKTGSLPAVLSARYVTGTKGNPASIVVLGETEKVAPPGGPEEHVVEENDPDQIVRAWGAAYNSGRVRKGGVAVSRILKERAGDPGRNIQDTHGYEEIQVAVHNVFFEWCPAELIDVYITELGQWTVKDIAQHSDKLGAGTGRLFSDI